MLAAAIIGGGLLLLAGGGDDEGGRSSTGLSGDGGAAGQATTGRATDGGFYLAAFNAAPDVDWASLPWFQSTIGDALVAALEADGFALDVLEPLADVDDAGDARRILGTIASIPLKLKAILRAALNATLSFVEIPAATPQRVLVTALYRRPPPH